MVWSHAWNLYRVFIQIVYVWLNGTPPLLIVDLICAYHDEITVAHMLVAVCTHACNS